MIWKGVRNDPFFDAEAAQGVRNMNQTEAFIYDQLPYPSLSHVNTHPDKMAVMGTLAGLHPAPVENCRVLELGTGSGGNLIPMAYALPHSQFLGIDLSGVQIAQGTQKMKELGLSNLRLEQMDIMNFPEDLGTFDYIISQGIFSWVPPQVREKILEIYRTHLAPHGIGFISYNTFPGWFMVGIVRDIMRYETRSITDPIERAIQARAALRFYANAFPESKSGYFNFLKYYSDRIDGDGKDRLPKNSSALYHDELAEINQPFYFWQFNQMTEQHGLRFVADFCHYGEGMVPKEALEALRKKSGSPEELEQALDFLENRTFRQTLVCLKEAPLNRKVTLEIVKGLYFASQAQPVSEKPDLFSKSVEQFRGPDGAILTVDHPCSKVALDCLAEAWPRALAFPELLATARARLKEKGFGLGDENQDAQLLGGNLLRAYGFSANMVELHSYAPALASLAGDQPVASRVARSQAVEEDVVTNLFHERILLDNFERYLLIRLDGTRNLQALLNELAEGPLANSSFTAEKEGQKINLSDHPEIVVDDLKYRLRWFEKLGLFIDPSRLRE
jgi:methyltransferase-like protein/ubiquinone/menaquinone biosynthesis C-methylase UbiE